VKPSAKRSALQEDDASSTAGTAEVPSSVMKAQRLLCFEHEHQPVPMRRASIGGMNVARNGSLVLRAGRAAAERCDRIAGAPTGLQPRSFNWGTKVVV
jgi:hypothetical protein